MKRAIINLNAFAKGVILLLKPHTFLGWLQRPFFTTANILSLSKWLAQQDKKGIYTDFYTSKRDYARRYGLYDFVADKHNLESEAFDYLEFGVCGGNSFKYWIEKAKNPNCKFYGFDTFEGLPEDWGTYKKGDMEAEIPQVEDERAEFLKGLFQDTLPPFIQQNRVQKDKKLIVHLDADLFSSTLFALTSLAPFLKKGDLVFFDEFNVPNHEFLAFKHFCDSYYFNFKLLGGVNNYYQAAFEVE